MSAELLQQLLGSAVFKRPLPARPVHSHAEWAALDDEQRIEAHQVGVTAIRLVPEHRKIAELIRGLANHPPATAALTDLWQRCSVSPIRAAAGHALLALDTAESRAPLIATIDEAVDHLSTHLGVRALFQENPATSYQRLLPWFDETRLRAPSGAVIPNAILWFFCPSSLRALGGGRMEPMWTEPRAPSWLDADWLRLCARLRQHDLVGANARDVLRNAPAGAVDRALGDSPLPPPPPAIKTAPGDLLTRYQRGEHLEVWRELRVHPRIEGALREEALAVARATMERVRQNVALLVERLSARGWKALGGRLHTPLGEEDRRAMTEVERRIGAPLPPSLRAFWEVVGGVDLVWDYNDDAGDFDLPEALVEADPLAVDPARVATYLFEEWEERIDAVRPELRDPYNLDLAPDRFHKANISGGAPYGIDLPFLGADPIWRGEAHELPFVDYLRLCFRWAGFPRLEHEPERWADLVRELAAGFITF